jgi:hypothetical protein
MGALFVGCVKNTPTDNRIIVAVQTFLDTPADPGKPDLLTPDERASIENFEVYKNTVKVHLKENTSEPSWSSIGSKVVKVFAKTERGLQIYDVSYICELYMPATFNEKKKVYKVGNIRLENATDRIYPELYQPIPPK